MPPAPHCFATFVREPIKAFIYFIAALLPVGEAKVLLLIAIILLFAMPFNANFGCSDCNLSPDGNSSENITDALQNASLGLFNSSSGSETGTENSSLLLESNQSSSTDSTSGTETQSDGTDTAAQPNSTDSTSQTDTTPSQEPSSQEEGTGTERGADASSSEDLSTSSAPLSVLPDNQEDAETQPTSQQDNLNITENQNATEEQNATDDLNITGESSLTENATISLINPTDSPLAEQQSAAIVDGAPVEWTATIESTAPEITIELPADAQITDATKTESPAEEQPAAQEPANQQAEITSVETIAQEPTPIEPVVIEQTDSTQTISLSDAAGTIELSFTTPAPTMEETELTETSKEIVVSSETHYENIMASTSLPSEVSSTSSIHLYWTIYTTTEHLDALGLSESELAELSASGELTKEAPFIASDTNENGLYDTIEWLVPSLSNQTYQLSLSVLTVYSHPTLYGNWSVEFNTTGTANLSIAATNDTSYYSQPTRWSETSEDSSLYDLHFLTLTCGGVPVPYNWSGTSCDSNDCPLTIENYNCDAQTSTLTSKVLTARPHVININFGGLSEYAYNDVSVSACQNLDTAGENYVLTGDVTGGAYKCFNVTAENVTLDCAGYKITGSNTTNT